MRHRWLLRGFIALLCVAASACSDESAAPSGGGGASGGSAIDCPATGVLHGPWSLAFDTSSAVVRWDACAPSATGIVIEPEGGGESVAIEGVQTAAEVKASYDVINGVPPDLPGTYYLTEAKAAGLEPGTCYGYTLGAEPARAGRFCTARSSGEGFRFMAIGDTNPAVGDTAGVLEHVLAHKPDFSVHLGDIQYYASVFESWAAWFPLMAPLLRAGPMMPCVGNHEDEIDFEFEDYYVRLFGGAGFDSDRVDYYRFQSGGVWFFSVSTEIDLKPGSEQAQWLEAQIADAAQQPGYRFGVVFMHKPFYTLSKYSQKSGEREHFKPIFEQYGVKLALFGHVHGYERFVDGGVTYIVSGGGGAALYDLDEKKDERPEEAALRVAAAEEYHAMLFELKGAELIGKAISNTGVELDSFTIALP